MSDTFAPPELKPVKIYDSGAVGLAVFLGSPVAGGLLLRRNFIALGDRGKGNKWLILSILLFTGLIMFGIAAGDSISAIGSTVINTLVAVIYTTVAKKHFETAVEERKALGYGLFSKLRATLVGLSTAALVLGGLFGAIYLFDRNPYNTPEDKIIRVKFEEVARLEETAERIMADFESPQYRPVQDRYNMIGQYQAHWERVEVLLGEIAVLAGVNDRKGTLEFVGMYREQMPLKIKIAENLKKFVTDNDYTAYEAALNAQSAIEFIDKRIVRFFDTLDDSTRDVIYLFP
ncbi:MAG: hypothetical protein LIO85_06990 [Rikenellaceae bacterium]|nr:hypothetical protein [Rikenellaceae bacterium]